MSDFENRFARNSKFLADAKQLQENLRVTRELLANATAMYENAVAKGQPLEIRQSMDYFRAMAQKSVDNAEKLYKDFINNPDYMVTPVEIVQAKAICERKNIPFDEEMMLDGHWAETMAQISDNPALREVAAQTAELTDKILPMHERAMEAMNRADDSISVCNRAAVEFRDSLLEPIEGQAGISNEDIQAARFTAGSHIKNMFNEAGLAASYYKKSAALQIQNTVGHVRDGVGEYVTAAERAAISAGQSVADAFNTLKTIGDEFNQTIVSAYSAAAVAVPATYESIKDGAVQTSLDVMDKAGRLYEGACIGMSNVASKVAKNVKEIAKSALMHKDKLLDRLTLGAYSRAGVYLHTFNQLKEYDVNMKRYGYTVEDMDYDTTMIHDSVEDGVTVFREYDDRVGKNPDGTNMMVKDENGVAHLANKDGISLEEAKKNARIIAIIPNDYGSNKDAKAQFLGKEVDVNTFKSKEGILSAIYDKSVTSRVELNTDVFKDNADSQDFTKRFSPSNSPLHKLLEMDTESYWKEVHDSNWGVDKDSPCDKLVAGVLTAGIHTKNFNLDIDVSGIVTDVNKKIGSLENKRRDLVDYIKDGEIFEDLSKRTGITRESISEGFDKAVDKINNGLDAVEAQIAKTVEPIKGFGRDLSITAGVIAMATKVEMQAGKESAINFFKKAVETVKEAPGNVKIALADAREARQEFGANLAEKIKGTVSKAVDSISKTSHETKITLEANAYVAADKVKEMFDKAVVKAEASLNQAVVNAKVLGADTINSLMSFRSNAMQAVADYYETKEKKLESRIEKIQKNYEAANQQIDMYMDKIAVLESQNKDAVIKRDNVVAEYAERNPEKAKIINVIQGMQKSSSKLNAYETLELNSYKRQINKLEKEFDSQITQNQNLIDMYKDEISYYTQQMQVYGNKLEKAQDKSQGIEEHRQAANDKLAEYDNEAFSRRIKAMDKEDEYTKSEAEQAEQDDREQEVAEMDQ